MLDRINNVSGMHEGIAHAYLPASGVAPQYQLGTTYSSRPLLVAYLGWDVGEWYGRSTPSLSVGVSDYSNVLREHLINVLYQYRKLTAKDWSRTLSIAVGWQDLPLPEYDALIEELDKRLAATEAKQVLADPSEKPILWEQVEAELGS